MTDSSVETRCNTPPTQAPLPLAPWTLADALAEKIRDHLMHQRLSQRAFGKQLGVSQGSVSYLLSVQRRQDTLVYCERLAKAFKVPISELFRELEGRVARSAAGKGRSHTAAERAAARTAEETVIRVFNQAGGSGDPHVADRALSDRSTIEQRLVFVSVQMQQFKRYYDLLLSQLQGEGDLVIGTITPLAAPGAPLPAGVPPARLPVDAVAPDHRQAPAPPAPPRPRRGHRRPRQY